MAKSTGGKGGNNSQGSWSRSSSKSDPPITTRVERVGGVDKGQKNFDKAVAKEMTARHSSEGKG